MPNERKVRVLIVDDSVVIRKILSDTISADPWIEVAGSAHDGKIALAKLPLCNPDLITLDIEMPVMNGLDTLVEIRKLYPKLPVVMFSTLTERGAGATLDALALGASDYATKPSNMGSPAAAIDAVRQDLIPKIKALCETLEHGPSAPHRETAKVTPRPRGPRRIDIVAIGTSTGGPNALAEVFPAFPPDFPVPIVTVQHMPPIFTRLLAERLSSHSQIPIEEGRAGQRLSPGHGWIAPGNFHMAVRRNGADMVLEVNQEAPEHSCRPAVDVLFRSVAATYGAGTLAVVMTGMGSDGVLGAKQIREAGGEVIIQDEASSVVWGMPGLTYASGQADGVYSLAQLGQETCLFRSRSQLDALRKVILPELTSDKIRQITKRLRIWSAGCSTGEEPYTLAMTLMEEKEGLLKDWQFEIVATDLNDRSVETAKEGVYGDYALRNTADYYKRRYFMPASDNKLQVRPDLKKFITFNRLNLQDDSKMLFMKGMDVIFCCNVLIYFDGASKARVIAHFFNDLIFGGYFFLGTSESILKLNEQFHLVHFPGSIAYWKPSLQGGKP